LLHGAITNHCNVAGPTIHDMLKVVPLLARKAEKNHEKYTNHVSFLNCQQIVVSEKRLV
jgi:hypothetical protein